MWENKLKAVTFSFDDGVIQDIRLIELLDKYGLKATFNLNSAFLGAEHKVDEKGNVLERGKISPKQVKSLYVNHEVGAHTLHHPNLVELTDQQIISQVVEDVKALEKLVEKPVKIFAYPFGMTDDRVCKILQEQTPIKLARIVKSADSFALPTSDFMCYKPTVHFCKVQKMFELAKEFINSKPDKPQLFYIWGHSYELDMDRISWEKFEEFCKLISNRDDIYYGTNSQVFGF